jgi:NADH dehydrogenase [ubiquinone] 1 alpha subcomplex assembly factor 5
MPHRKQPSPLKKRTDVQHAAQSRKLPSIIVKHPAQRDGRAKSARARNGAAKDGMLILSFAFPRGTSRFMQQSEIFDRNARRVKRFQVFKAAQEDRWLIDWTARELVARFEETNHEAKQALLIGCDNDHVCNALATQHVALIRADTGSWGQDGPGFVQGDEDMLPFADSSFDLIFAVGTLDSVNDLPGALILIRKMLKPAGLFLGSFFGVGTLPTLKSILREGTENITRVHPLIDVRGAGDLLSRAGFANPVADMETITARYSDLRRLLGDVRANGLGNSLLKREPIPARVFDTWKATFEKAKDENGKVSEDFAPIYLTGKSPLVIPAT